MSKDELVAILSEMDELWKNFKFCRSLTPAIDNSAVGHSRVIYAPFYGEQRIFSLSPKGLSKEDILQIRKAGHYINQNYILRLYAFLQTNHIVFGDICIDYTLDGSEHLNILNRLRNKFAHGSGKFNVRDNDDIKLNKTMEELYELITPPNDPNEFRLPINDVLKKMFEGCKEYVTNYYDSIKIS